MSVAPIQDDRTKHLHATDIAALIGCDPYRTSLDVWLEKTGRVAPFAGNMRTRIGLALEDACAAEYADLTGFAVERSPRPLDHPEGWFVGNPDFHLPATQRLLSIKTANPWVAKAEWGEPWTDAVPARHALQETLYGGLRDVWHADWALYVLGETGLRIYRAELDRGLYDAAIDVGRRFWHDHVVADVQPAIDYTHKAGAAFVRSRAGAGGLPPKTAPDEAMQWAEQLRAANAEARAARVRKTEAETHLVELCGEHDGLRGPDWTVAYKLRDGRMSWAKAFRALASAYEELRSRAEATGIPAGDMRGAQALAAPFKGEGRRGFKATFEDCADDGAEEEAA